MNSNKVSRAMLVLVCAGLAACEADESSVRRIVTTREVDVTDVGLAWNATTKERFGLASMGQAPAPPPPAAEPSLEWRTPPGWQEVAPTQFRAVNFLLPGEPPGECYLTILRGDAGGLVANVNRWRQQMSLPPLAVADVGQLPRLPFLGGEAAYLDLEGTFSGMNERIGAGYRLLGLLLIDRDGSRFLKLVGPRAVVDGQLESFRDLAASFALKQAPATNAPASAATAGGLEFEAPEHWVAAPAQPMRQVNFLVGPAGEVECYVTVLSGGAGGAHANVNRWCGQMGRPELTATAFAALERFPMLGGEAALAEIDGAFSAGARRLDDARLLGVVAGSSSGTTFVKMIGPRELVAREREAFLAFCKSLRMGD